MAHLIYEYPSDDSRVSTETPPAAASRSKVLDYLKTLPPPAVDLELRSLCTHDEDEEGIQLVRFLLVWFVDRMVTGLDFEVMEAYLHRTLLIFGEKIMKRGELSETLRELRLVHEAKSARFGSLVQQNLCMLKLFANLPI